MKISIKTMAATIAASTTSIQKLLAFCLLIMLFSSFEAEACNVCPPNTPWISFLATSPAKTLYVVDNNQSLLIDYSYRTCIIGGVAINEIRINGLYKTDGTYTGTISANLNKAIKKVLYSSTRLFNTTGPNGWNVIVNTECCWKTTLSVIGGTTDDVVPCQNSSCCSKSFTMKYVNSGTKLEVNNSVTVNPPCFSGTLTCPSNIRLTESECFFVCDAQDIDNHTDLFPYGENACNGCNLAFDVSGSKYFDYNSVSTGIKYNVEYSYKFCDGVLWFTFNEVHTTDGNLVDFTDFKELVPHTIKLMINSGLIGSFPTTVYFSIPSCWKNNVAATIPCSFTNCCITELQVDYLDSGVPTYQLVSQNLTSNSTSCTDAGCINICSTNYLDFTLYTALPKLSLRLNESLLTRNKLIIKPNPTSGISSIDIESEITGKLTLKVVDLLGKEVKRIEKVKNGKTFNLQFDGSDLPQGSYQVQLEIENQVVANGNLLIQR